MVIDIAGADPGGHPAYAPPPPPPPPSNWKKYDFWRKIVIFHMKYPQKNCVSLHSAQFFLCPPPPNLKSWIRPCIVHALKNHVIMWQGCVMCLGCLISSVVLVFLCHI